MDTSLRNRHALVCGASAGIGRAVARAFAAEGAGLTLLARRRERLEALVSELGTDVHTMVADLDDRPALYRALADHLRQHGPVHILVNNTGGPSPGPILDAEEIAFEQAFGRHILAAHGLLQRLLPGMQEAGYGRVINIVSTSVREPIANLGVSNTIRGAMAAWAKTVANELPAGITINNVLPGFTDTERLAALGAATAERRGVSRDKVTAEWLARVPEGRLGQPDEIAAAVAFLASPAAGFIRGVSLAVDGGRMASI